MSRGHGATVLVAALATALGVGLLAAIEVMISAIHADPLLGDDGNVRFVLTITAMTFIAVSVYVAAVVTTNTVATIVVGRRRELALARLLGATASSRRRLLAREGLLAGGLGAVIGAAAGLGIVMAATLIGVATGAMPDTAYGFVSPAMIVPPLGVTLVTWLAAWVGSRRVLRVAPIAALGAAVPEPAEAVAAHRGRRVAAGVLFWTGTAVLAASALLGLLTPIALLSGVVGGMLSFTGVVLGAEAVMPRAIALVGALLGRRGAGRLATANAAREPQRSARATVGLVIGTALVTMFVVAAQTAGRILVLSAEAQWGDVAPVQDVLDRLMAVFGALVGYSAIIAAVGLVNALTVSVLQRGRELGLMRALGLSRSQLRAVIAGEAAQLAITALVVGVVLGIGYGWVAAMALLGSFAGPQPPVVPWWLLAGVAVAGGTLTLAASLLSARRAARPSPVEALAVP